MISSDKYFCLSGWRLRKSQAAQATTCCIYAHRLVLRLACHFLKNISAYPLLVYVVFLHIEMDWKMFQMLDLFNRYQGDA